MGPAFLRFIDACAPRPYCDLGDMHGLGGTEATLIRIAKALARDMSVTVEQAARQATETRDGVMFLPIDLKRSSGRVIVVINSWKVALLVRKHNPAARICVWQHVVPGRHNRAMVTALAAAQIDIMCVSHSHAKQVRSLIGADMVRVSAILNPIADDLHPDQTQRDPDLLFFASSPHKGLDQVAARFTELRQAIPSLRLELADPGYLAWGNGTMPPGVVQLGTLTHAQVIAKMRRALCLFYPQTRFAETFGLVIAEANAVGCPALVHGGLGANDEVVSDRAQCIDATDPAQIMARLLAWRRDKPTITLKPEFRFSAVLRQWQAILDPILPPGIASSSRQLHPKEKLHV